MPPRGSGPTPASSTDGWQGAGEGGLAVCAPQKAGGGLADPRGRAPNPLTKAAGSRARQPARPWVLLPPTGTAAHTHPPSRAPGPPGLHLGRPSAAASPAQVPHRLPCCALAKCSPLCLTGRLQAPLRPGFCIHPLDHCFPGACCPGGRAESTDGGQPQ